MVLASSVLDRVLVLEMVRVTEAAAIAASTLIGRGDEKAADAAAVEAMRAALNELPMDGTVVIGEGERDEAPMLYIGEKVGSAQDSGPRIDIALDPLEGTTITAKAGPNALADLEKSFAKRTGREPDRVNPVLGIIGRGSKDTEFYEAVFERLAEAEPLPDAAMQELAARRARAIVDALAKGGINSGQVSSGAATQVKADSERRVVTELALEAL